MTDEEQKRLLEELRELAEEYEAAVVRAGYQWGGDHLVVEHETIEWDAVEEPREGGS